MHLEWRKRSISEGAGRKPVLLEAVLDRLRPEV